jgi:hypothetical protein
MLLWLWDASGPGQYHGVADDEARARQAAEACIVNGQAAVARVERAQFVMDGWFMHPAYRRTGIGWTARRSGRGVCWAALTVQAAS